MLGIVFAVKTYRCYLLNRKFTIYTDHKPLTGALRSQDTTSRLTNLLNKLIDYDYEIKYKPGKLNLNSDALSRLPYEDFEDHQILAVTRSKTKAQKEKQTEPQKNEVKVKTNIEQNRYAKAQEITEEFEKETILTTLISWEDIKVEKKPLTKSAANTNGKDYIRM